MKSLLTILLLAICLSIGCLHAQDTTKVRRNAVHGTLLGQAGLASVGYERKVKFLSSRKFEGLLGISAGGYPMTAEDHLDQHLIVTPEYAMLFGKKKHHLELGLLLNFYFLTHVNEWQDTVFDLFFPSIRIGYRYEPSSSKLFFRAGALPTVLYLGEPNIVPWPYFGGGIRF